MKHIFAGLLFLNLGNIVLLYGGDAGKTQNPLTRGIIPTGPQNKKGTNYYNSSCVPEKDSLEHLLAFNRSLISQCASQEGSKKINPFNFFSPSEYIDHLKALKHSQFFIHEELLFSIHLLALSFTTPEAYHNSALPSLLDTIISKGNQRLNKMSPEEKEKANAIINKAQSLKHDLARFFSSTMTEMYTYNKIIAGTYLPSLKKEGEDKDNLRIKIEKEKKEVKDSIADLTDKKNKLKKESKNVNKQQEHIALNYYIRTMEIKKNKEKIEKALMLYQEEEKETQEVIKSLRLSISALETSKTTLTLLPNKNQNTLNETSVKLKELQSDLYKAQLSLEKIQTNLSSAKTLWEKSDQAGTLVGDVKRYFWS